MTPLRLPALVDRPGSVVVIHQLDGLRIDELGERRHWRALLITAPTKQRSWGTPDLVGGVRGYAVDYRSQEARVDVAGISTVRQRL